MEQLSREQIMDEEFCDSMFQKLKPVEIHYMKDAMQRYADQERKKEAIAFTEWREIHYGLIDVREGNKYIWTDNEGDEEFTTEQLYDIYEKEKPHGHAAFSTLNP